MIRKILSCAFTLLLFASCEKVDDDTDLKCIVDCTHIEGRIVTEGDLPVKNVQLEFRFTKSIGTNANYVRKIARAKTDANGNYSMDFYLKDEEIGEASGWLELFVKQNTVRDPLFFVNNFNLFEGVLVNDRNSPVTKNIYLPTKKDIEVKLQNFVAIQDGDYFEVQLYVPCGFKNSEIDVFSGTFYRYQTEGINMYRMNTSSETFTISAALNEVNYVVLVRIKNGIYSEETIPINISENSNEIFTYDF